MQSLPSQLSVSLVLWMFLLPTTGFGEEFSVRIKDAYLDRSAKVYKLMANIEYQLSTTAKEALYKGVPLTWDVILEINESGWLWDRSLYRQKLQYSLQYHALLNQYLVKSIGQTEMFLSLSAALNFMSAIQDQVQISGFSLDSSKGYQLKVKSEFNRELLPIPLRPIAYLDSQWFLSSNWFVWQIQK
jgi:hypothetical protein